MVRLVIWDVIAPIVTSMQYINIYMDFCYICKKNKKSEEKEICD